jgi:hypothetical protein
MRTIPAVVCVVIAFATLACERRSETVAPASPPGQPPAVSAPTPTPARVTSIDLGSAIGADGRVAAGAAKTTFAPTDTIYVSIVTDKPPAGASLSARWTYEDGQLVSEGNESLTSSDRTATEFHISKPDGFPAGRYRVEIALNGQSAGSREFEVR